MKTHGMLPGIKYQIQNSSYFSYNFLKISCNILKEELDKKR